MTDKLVPVPDVIDAEFKALAASSFNETAMTVEELVELAALVADLRHRFDPAPTGEEALKLADAAPRLLAMLFAMTQRAVQARDNAYRQIPRPDATLRWNLARHILGDQI